jgi:hypothetical protein
MRTEEEIKYLNLGRTGYGDCDHYWSQPESVVAHSSSNYGPGSFVGNYTSIDVGSEAFMALGPASTWGARQWIGSELWTPENMAYAMYRMQPKIRVRVSLINFLVELREFKRMFDFWNFRRSLLRNIANGVLNYKFGWKPFLSDVVAILNGLLNVRRELRKLIDELGTVVKRSYRFKIRSAGTVLTQDAWGEDTPPKVAFTGRPNEDLRPWEHGFVPPAWYLYGYKRQFVLAKDQWANYTMRCSYLSPTLCSAYAELLAFLDAFDLVWDPAIIWNAVPFSFVVDWFYDVGQWLSKFGAVPWHKLYFRVHDMCLGTKVEGHGTTWYRWNVDPRPNEYTEAQSFFKDTGKVYSRKTPLPTVEALLQAGYSRDVIEHIVLGASLLVTNNRFIRPRRRAPRK